MNMMKIEITAEGGKMRQTLDEALATLGYVRMADQATHGKAMLGTSLSSYDEADDSQGVRQRVEQAVGADVAHNTQQVGDAPKRERGKPGPGRQRRTKEEMAEDQAADDCDAAAGLNSALEKQLISSAPENRVGPQDSAESQAQDAADEAAESAASKKALTLDDVRDVVGRYYTKFGMGPATGDVRTIFGCAMVDIPTTQEAFTAAIAAVEDAIATNPYGRAVVGAAATETKPAATIDQLKAVMGRYMQRFGEDEGFADLPKILEVDNIKLLPNDPVVYATKIAAVETALVGNPFERSVRA